MRIEQKYSNSRCVLSASVVCEVLTLDIDKEYNDGSEGADIMLNRAEVLQLIEYLQANLERLK